ncbi:MAG: diguanylate cyclase protein [Herbinix sp.]|nr:diguanylate cyclase protein [Herbinix sp.]
MSLMGNTIINIYSIMLLIIIFFQSIKQHEKDSFQYRIFMSMIAMVIVLLIMDIFSRFDGKPDTFYYAINRFGNFMIFSLNLVMPSLWFLYVYNQVYHEESKMKRVFFYFIALNCINVIMVALSQLWGWFYYFDSNNIYHRGPLYCIPVIITGSLLIYIYYFIIKNRKRIDKNHYIALAYFLAPPCIGIIFQIIFYGISLILNCLVLSLLIVYLNIQNHNMYTDYLTGVYNRKKLDQYLKSRIEASTEDKTFSAIMIDLNNFKKINDTWGHDEGDKALRMATTLLGSCLREDDFIARFGGDEFCIILDVISQERLDEIVQRINHTFENYNATCNQPYTLSYSIGYALYDYHSKMKMEEFQKQLDMLLYDDKQCKNLSLASS